MFHLFSIQTKSKEQLVNIDIEHKVTILFFFNEDQVSFKYHHNIYIFWYWLLNTVMQCEELF